ncbi:MAG TPA: glycosyltransferase [Candidatus Binatia bacterium]|nr:glycosyltransferase [Candidatus Binatia bacterium]
MTTDLVNGNLQRIALFLPDLGGGGVQKATLALADGLTKRGHQVDLVLCRIEGPLHNQVPDRVKLIELKAAPAWLGRAYALAADPKGLTALLRPVLLPVKPSQTLPYLPDLVRYLRRERPAMLISAKPHLNLEAVWARRLAAVPTRVVVSEQNSLSQKTHTSKRWKRRFLPPLAHRTYLWADSIVAVSNGVADDLSAVTGIPRERITTIYNPVVTPELLSKAQTPFEHPWFTPGAPPVLLGAGRLTAQKDFPTLLRAFARARVVREARLVILGEGKKRTELEMLAQKLGVAADVNLPGWVDNPFAWMARAAVFVLSSAWEGFGNVVAEALACGCPVVSTDCPSGPAEILDGGAYGPLVPVGDDAALAKAILSVMETPPDPDRLQARAAMFSVDRVVNQYLQVLFVNQEES